MPIELDKDSPDYWQQPKQNIRFQKKAEKVYTKRKYQGTALSNGNADLDYMGGKHKILTREEEQDLGARALAGERAAQDALVLHNMKLVISIAKRFASSSLPLDDCIGIGSTGLVEAAKRFDPKRGTKFCTYATYWIKMRLYKAAGEVSPTCIHVPRQYKVIAKELRMGKEVKESHKEAYGISELTKAAPLDVYVLEELNDNRAVAANKEDEPLYDDLAYEILEAALSRLNERDRFIVEAKNGLGEFKTPLTLLEVGKLCVPPITRERVRQIHNRAMTRLKNHMADLGASTYEDVA